MIWSILAFSFSDIALRFILFHNASKMWFSSFNWTVHKKKKRYRYCIKSVNSFKLPIELLKDLAVLVFKAVKRNLLQNWGEVPNGIYYSKILFHIFFNTNTFFILNHPIINSTMLNYSKLPFRLQLYIGCEQCVTQTYFNVCVYRICA